METRTFVLRLPFVGAYSYCMNTLNSPKALSHGRAGPDWHAADIVAALRKRGWSLRRLSIAHGYAPNTISQAIHRPWPKGERVIADAIGVRAEDIWPSRAAVRRCFRASSQKSVVRNARAANSED